jgi:predicted O-methyltransferase YrrM
MQKQWTAIDEYFEDLFLPKDEALSHVLTETAKTEIQPIHVAPNQGRFLYIMAKLMNARRILELGTLGGYSTIAMARALPDDGKIITLEFDPRCIRLASRHIAHAGLEHKIEIMEGFAEDSMRALHESGAAPFDMIFMDADKKNNSAYFDLALKLSRKGTLIIADNVVRGGKIIDEKATNEHVLGLRDFNQKVSQTKGIAATALQTVGAKGYDGLALILVEDAPQA